MQFSPVTPKMREVLAPYFTGLVSRTCDLTLGTVLMWSEVNHTEYCVAEDALFLRFQFSDSRVYYNLPLSRDVPRALQFLLDCTKEETLTFVAVPEEYLGAFDTLSAEVTLRTTRDYYDYLYRAQDLRELSGKRYAKKRNLISQFDRAYPDSVLEEVGEANLDEARAFFEAWVRDAGESLSVVEDLERRACMLVLSDPHLCGMQGALLRADGRVVGLSLGEVLGDTLFTHVEKADRNYKGVYQKLTNLFVRRFGDDVLFVNREDDAGDEGLRRAKLDYHPHALLVKHSVTVKK